LFVNDTLLEVVCLRISEQELELHLSDSTIRKKTFAVEPRQLALKVRLTYFFFVATLSDRGC
jgi:hypothetical protein